MIWEMICKAHKSELASGEMVAKYGETCPYCRPNKVFIVWFINLYSEDFEFIGAFSTREKAEAEKQAWIKAQTKAPKWYQEAVEIIEEEIKS